MDLHAQLRDWVFLWKGFSNYTVIRSTDVSPDHKGCRFFSKGERRAMENPRLPGLNWLVTHAETVSYPDAPLFNRKLETMFVAV